MRPVSLLRLRIAAPALLAAAVLLACAPAEPPAPTKIDNAVLICIDTVRYDTFELVRSFHAGDETDRLWGRGTRFTRAQSAAPWTLPSVGSVFTGLYPNQHRTGAFPDPVADLTKQVPGGLKEGTPTLAKLLWERGFETLGVIAHGWLHFGLQRGFEKVRKARPDSGEVTERFLAWLGERDMPERRFFAYLHYMAAHRPMHLGPKKLADDEPVAPELARLATEAHPTACVDPATLGCLRYQGYVRAVDRLRGQVGEVLAALEAQELLDSTVVVLFADHGEEFGEHEEQERARSLDPRGTYGLGHGHSLFQEQLHVPLVVWHPALAPGEVDARVSLIDVAPTLLGWLDVEVDADFAGIDLGPILAAGESAPDRPLFASSPAFGPDREAVVRGDRKRISDGGSGAGALHFDLAADPAEASPAPGDPDGLAPLLAEYRRNDTSGHEAARPSDEELEGLQALGYLTDVEHEREGGVDVEGATSTSEQDPGEGGPSR